ncbi:MAG: serine/threonine-protein kinase [Archangium sp.]
MLEATVPRPLDEASTDVGRTRNFGFEPVSVSQSSAPSRMLERYEPLDQLARGGMGQVLLAVERPTGRRVALKLMHGHMLNDEALVQQFAREALITARLEHPNVVPVYDLGFIGGGELYYAMRFVKGQSLRAAMPKVDRPRLLRALSAAARGVCFAHEQGLWHRDVKPENILLGPHEDTYVIDWGLVSLVKGARFEFVPAGVSLGKQPILEFHEQRATEKALTGSGAMMGTLPYMAPEQAMADDRIGPGSDAWAFGVMLCELVSGEHPYCSPTEQNGNAVVHDLIQFARAPKFSAKFDATLEPLARGLLAQETQTRLSALRTLSQTW